MIGTLAGLKISDGVVKEDWKGLGSTPEPFQLASGSDKQDSAAQTFIAGLPPTYRAKASTVPLQSVQEVESYGIALTPLIGQGKARTLACYMGGETKDPGAFDGESYLNSVEEIQSQCVMMDKNGNVTTPAEDRNPGKALLALRAKSPWVHRLIRDKIYARSVSKQTSLDENIDQEVAAFYKKVGEVIKSVASFTPWILGGAVVLYLVFRFGVKR